MSRIYLRIFGYLVTLTLHIGNGLYMRSFHQGAVLEDPQISAYIGLQYRFITCWNFLLQIVYAFIGLACDLLTLAHSSNKKYKVPHALSDTRDTLYTAVIWPGALQVAALFWPFYLYDTALVYPPFIGRILTPLSNHIIHTAIVPIALWELVCRPQKEPESHGRLATILTVYTLVYWFTLFYTYFEQGIWIYPVFKKIEGTIYVPLLIYYTCILLVFYYNLQWFITRRLYPAKIRIGKVNKKVK